MMYEIKTINLGEVNCYLIKTIKGFVLIDTGGPTIFNMNWERVRSNLERELIGSGCEPGNLNLIIITHGDIDHIWNCVYLKEKYKAKILMHKGDAIMVEKSIIPNRKSKSIFSMARWIIPMMLKMPKLIKLVKQFEKFIPDLYIEDNFDLSEYGFNAKILHLPGHTKGSIGIITDKGELFCGDTVVNIQKPDIFPFADNFDDINLSIKRIKELNIKTVYPGHGNPFQMELFT